MKKFGQSLALSKNLLIAVQRLSGDGLALSVSLCSPALPLGATATTAASGGNREELLGPRPARMRAAAKQTLGAATRAVALRSNDGEVSPSHVTKL